MALAEFVAAFRRAGESYDPAAWQTDTPPFVLDGQAGAELRRLLPVAHRRRLGAFFTPHELAHRLTAPLANATGDLVVVDPSCGAGDLLLAAVQVLAPALRSGRVRARLVGIDIVPEFAETARLRLDLLCRSLGAIPTVQIRRADGRSDAELGAATHLMLNPPFAAVHSAQDCSWARGNVSGAADFLAKVVARIPEGSHVAAILPEVLRGGSRYRRWRDWIEQHLGIQETVPLGRFDRWTDVDVFIMRGHRQRCLDGKGRHHWIPSHQSARVGDYFDISVGPVVHNRHAERGPSLPYLTAKGLPPWGTVKEVRRRRRFNGRIYSGPLVVIPRTSRPDEAGRARAALVPDLGKVAVDNHLIVLTPKSGGLNMCHTLLQVLRAPESDKWLDATMRCRHLTVGAIADLPWNASASSVLTDDPLLTSES